MEKKNILKGVLFVGVGASIYGMLATLLNWHIMMVIQQQKLLLHSLCGNYWAFDSECYSDCSVKERASGIKRRYKKLMLAGTSLGGTSLFYYLSVQYINVSIAIVLLMQSV